MLVSSPIGASLLERRLLAAARDRDQHAMSVLLRSFWPVAHAAAGRVHLPPGVDREDIEQAALSGVLGAIETWEPGRASLASYVRICASNAAKNAVKKACAARNRPLTRAVSLDALAETGREPACGAHGALATTDPLDIVILNEEIYAMTAAVPTFTAKEKFGWLGDVNGRSHAEMAAAIGATTRAVATAIARARKKLKAAKENGPSARPSH
jgi:RNA polymerase sigma factor (sigma-70 family)